MKEVLATHTLTALRMMVRKHNIKGYSKMKKGELIDLMTSTEHSGKFSGVKPAATKKSKVVKPPARSAGGKDAPKGKPEPPPPPKKKKKLIIKPKPKPIIKQKPPQPNRPAPEPKPIPPSYNDITKDKPKMPSRKPPTRNIIAKPQLKSSRPAPKPEPKKNPYAMGNPKGFADYFGMKNVNSTDKILQALSIIEPELHKKIMGDVDDPSVFKEWDNIGIPYIKKKSMVKKVSEELKEAQRIGDRKGKNFRFYPVKNLNIELLIELIKKNPEEGSAGIIGKIIKIRDKYIAEAKAAGFGGRKKEVKTNTRIPSTQFKKGYHFKDTPYYYKKIDGKVKTLTSTELKAYKKKTYRFYDGPWESGENPPDGSDGDNLPTASFLQFFIDGVGNRWVNQDGKWYGAGKEQREAVIPYPTPFVKEPPK
jgi:hypothetical protein